MKIIVDIFGSDDPARLLTGCALCTVQLPEVTLVLTGDEVRLRQMLSGHTYAPERIELMHAPELITNDDDPIEAVMHRRDSSLVAGIVRMRSDPEIVGMLTAGSTGAAYAAGVAFAGRLPGVHTPTLATFLPSMTGRNVCLADCGANINCKPDRLAQFALQGVALMQAEGVEHPCVGLLSVGVEEHKGNPFTQEAFAALSALPIDFAGNMEARDALTGKYDVIVSDGFSGNVLLKTVESAGLFAGHRLRMLSNGDTVTETAADKLTQELDFASNGAAMLLGLRKPLLKAHGSATERTVPNAVRQLLRLRESDFPQRLNVLLRKL